MFRQFAQQMGLQNTRAILPEQIDLLLNTSIGDTVNDIIRTNIGITNDRVITDNSKIGQINDLKGLYTTDEFNCIKTTAGVDGIFTHNKADDFNGRLKGVLPIDPLYYVDFSVNYIKGGGDISDAISYDENNDFTTNYFPVRLIDDAYLSDTLNDFVLKNRLRSPIMVIYNRGDKTIFDMYVDKVTNGTFVEGLVPKYLRVSYIAKPAKVAYKEDIDGTNVDCNLPEHLHIQIVKHAVDLFHTALTGDLHARQQANQQQTQEDMRNQAQPYSQQPQGGQQQ